MDKTKKEVEKLLLQGVSTETLLAGCIRRLSCEIMANKIPPSARYEFNEKLSDFIKSAMPANLRVTNPTSYMTMMLEGYIRIAARLIVSIATINPCLLQKTGGIPEDKVKLLRRGMEDHLVDLSVEALKRCILHDHLSYSDFITEKEEERKCGNT